MLVNLLFLGAGIAIGVFRPTIGRDARKQIVRAGLGISGLAKTQVERVKEDIADIVTEIEHEKQEKQARALAPVAPAKTEPS
jgi:hypothetical protein